MTEYRQRLLSAIACTGLLAALIGAERVVAVNDYLGMGYKQEAVSWDWQLPEPTPLASIGIIEQASQVELLTGSVAAAERVRIWTTVSMPADGHGRDRHRRLTLTTAAPDFAQSEPWEIVESVHRHGLPLVAVGNGLIRIRLPAASRTFDPPLPAVQVPGPIVAIARDDEDWVGDGYLDTIARVSALQCRISSGPVFYQHELVYAFTDGGRYAVQVRLPVGKPFATLTEDCTAGGNARYIFNYQDWRCDAFFKPGDSRRYDWAPLDQRNPCGDFVQIDGQRALARLVIWSQFNYFAGKQETVCLKAPDAAALEEHYAQQRDKHAHKLAKWQNKHGDQDDPTPPPELPAQPPLASEPVVIDGVSMPGNQPHTPGGTSTAIGAFFIRPDLWTRAKINHIDLYLRPEVPGEPLTRGITGLPEAVLRPALEAWIVDGHRRWALFAVASGERDWLARAHVREGVWPLDRLNRLPLVWNSDGSPVAPRDTIPGDEPIGGTAAAVLKGVGGRSGLQYFNGSNGHIRGSYPKAQDAEPQDVLAREGSNDGRVGLALAAYMGADDSAYPSRRAMLPWSHPEALNPFYQGMENMNFNADLYRWIVDKGCKLKGLGHPQADRFIDHGVDSLDRALDRYVYPGGCWEESHGYAGHTIGIVTPLAWCLKDLGIRNFFDDVRLIDMLHFFAQVYSPTDLTLSRRVVPPIGDHGLSLADPAERLGKKLGAFIQNSTDPDHRAKLAAIAGLVAESFGDKPDGLDPTPVARRSTWMQGYGAVLRSPAPQLDALRLRLPGALVKFHRKNRSVDLDCVVPLTSAGTPLRPAAVVAKGLYRSAILLREATIETDGVSWIIGITVDFPKHKKTAAGTGAWTITLLQTDDGWQADFQGTYRSQEQEHGAEGRCLLRLVAGESQVTLRSGQSWGHHHADKGSLWVWFRGVPLCGDASWGSPPGGTYWNPYKQGPASGTQIEFVGINNWTLPCKFPAGWIAERQYDEAFDYACARNLYPYNAAPAFDADRPVALANGYDRQVLFIHPDRLLVRDNVVSQVPTIWRFHSYRGADNTVITDDGAGARLRTPFGFDARLRIHHPTSGVQLQPVDTFPEVHPFGRDPNPYAGQPFGSRILRWDMPAKQSATWSLIANDQNDTAAQIHSLDDAGRVTRIDEADGSSWIACMASEPFTAQVLKLRFDGRVGLLHQSADGDIQRWPIDGDWASAD